MTDPRYTRWQEPKDDQAEQDEEEEIPADRGNVPSNHNLARVLQCSDTSTANERDPATTARLICIMGLGCAVMCCIGVTIGYNLPRKGESNVTISLDPFHHHHRQMIDEKAQWLYKNISKENIKTYLEAMSKLSRNAVLPYIEEKFSSFGYRVKKTSFWVTLSQPDRSNPNRIYVKYKNGSTETLNVAPDYLGDFLPYAFYSPSNIVNSTVVYANYGTMEDLTSVRLSNVKLAGQIILIKLSKDIHLSTVVRNAERYRVAGIIYYPDPSDFRGDNNGGDPYPEGTGLPSDGIYWGNVKLTPGDPANPTHPALGILEDSSTTNMNITSVVVQPVTSDTASKILALLGGSIVSKSWRGGLDREYNLGGSWKRGNNVSEFIMEVNNKLVNSKITNLHAFFPAVDVTKVIHIGCHYDQWKPEGADNVGSGVGVFLELGRAFMNVYPNGLERQLLFSAWDAEEFGSIGSLEFSKQYFSWIGSTSVAYLNIDQEFLQGQGALEVQATPLIREVFNMAAEYTVWPDNKDVFVKHKLQSLSEHGEDYFTNIESDGDCYSFIADHGIPSLNLKVLGANLKSNYSLYHTQYDTLEAVVKFLDPEFEWAHLVASLTGISALILAESKVIPVKFKTLSTELEFGWENIKAKYRGTFPPKDRDFSKLLNSIDGELQVLASRFLVLDLWYSVNHNETEEGYFREIEQRIGTYMGINKHFLRPRRKDFSYLKNDPNSDIMFSATPRIESSLITFGPDSTDPAVNIPFPRLTATLRQVQAKTKSWSDVKEELVSIFASLRSFRDIIDKVPEQSHSH